MRMAHPLNLSALLTFDHSGNLKKNCIFLEIMLCKIRIQTSCATTVDKKN